MRSLSAIGFVVAAGGCFWPVDESDAPCLRGEVSIPFIAPDGGHARDLWGLAGLWDVPEPALASMGTVALAADGTIFVDGLNAAVSANLEVKLLSEPAAPFGDQVIFRRWVMAGAKVFKSYARYASSGRTDVVLGLHEYRSGSAALVESQKLLDVPDAGYLLVPKPPQSDPAGNFLCFGVGPAGRGEEGTVFVEDTKSGRRLETQEFGGSTCWQVRRRADGSILALMRRFEDEAPFAGWSLLTASAALDLIGATEPFSAFRCTFVEGATPVRVACSLPAGDGADIVILDDSFREVSRWSVPAGAILLGARVRDGQVESVLSLGQSPPELAGGVALLRDGRVVASRDGVGLPAAVAPTENGWIVAGPGGGWTSVVVSRWCVP